MLKIITPGLRAFSPLLTALLLFSTAPQASETGIPTEEDFFEDIPVVLSVTRLEQPITHAPAAITIITQEMIEASGARSLPDVFRIVPGFLVDYELGNRPVVTYHGLSDAYSRRIQVLVDGRSVYLPSDFGVRWSDLPIAIEDIEKIEVIRGPNTAAYGANAFLATISIHTRALPEEDSTYVRALYGRYDERRFVARHEGSANKLKYRVNAAFEFDDLYGHISHGFKNGDESQNIYHSNTLVERRNDFKRNFSLSSKIGYRLSTNDYLTVDLGMLRGRRGEGNFAHSGNIAEIYDVRVNTHYQQLKWQRKLGLDNDISIQFYHNHHSTLDQYTELQELNAPWPWNQDFKSNRYDLEVQHTFKPSDSTRLVWGVNSRIDKVSSPTYFYDNNQHPVQFRLNRIYGNLEWYLLDNLSTNIGVMTENNNFIGTETSPRVGLNYSIAKNHALRAIISKAIRVPSPMEEASSYKLCGLDYPTCNNLFHYYGGNPDLKAEEIISREIGYHGVLSKGASLDIKAYKDTIKNYVCYSKSNTPECGINPGPSYLTFENSKNIYVRGVEVETDIRPTDRDYIRIGYAHTNIDTDGNQDNVQTSMPRTSVSALLSHKFDYGIKTSLAYYYMNRYEPLDGNPIPEIRRADFSISKAFKSGGADAKVSLVAQSILGDYVSNSWDKLTQNTAYISLELDY